MEASDTHSSHIPDDSVTSESTISTSTAHPSSSSQRQPSSSQQTRPKSPPLAFEPTPNDSLAPRLSPNPHQSDQEHTSSSSPLASTMGRLDSPSVEALHLQMILDQQANAIALLHDAFSAERSSWTLERERLYQRIASLEKLLRSGDHHSPAKSPMHSPASGAVASPQSRGGGGGGLSGGISTLPSIAEDTQQPSRLSRRREGAPSSISIPSIREDEREKERERGEARRNSTVGFAEDDTPTHAIKVEEIPISPSNARAVSPPPASFRREAGSTPPLHAIRPPTPPPKNSLSMDGIEDTPTRNNTHINAFLTRSNDSEDGDAALKGPLNLPELPRAPNEANFTLEMLSRKLEQIEQFPDERTSRPMVFAQPSPGLASPTAEAAAAGGDYLASKPSADAAATASTEAAAAAAASVTDVDDEAPIAPVGTAIQPSTDRSSTSVRSPKNTTKDDSGDDNERGSPVPLSPQVSRERQHYEQGGIRLKKKPSTNFGAPFGSLSGFGSVRRQS